MTDTEAKAYPIEWFRDHPVAVTSHEAHLAIMWSSVRLGADDRGRVTSPRAQVTATQVG